MRAMASVLAVMVVSWRCLAFDATYAAYASFLERYVCPEGVVYSQIGGDSLLDIVSTDMASLSRSAFDALTKEEQIAYLTNVYNFHTVALITRHYPLKTGIRDIAKPWDTPFVPLFGAKVTLNHIEHEILRKNYDEPLVHFALNCASIGCPRLQPVPFSGSQLTSQLQSAALTFLTDSTQNRFDGKKLYLSQIFDWYGGDFRARYGDYTTFAADMMGVKGKPKVKFIAYNWSLNETPPCRKAQ